MGARRYGQLVQELAGSRHDDGRRIVGTVGYTQLFNASGHPAMSVPLCFSAAGLPIGIQLAARFGDEATLFRVAAQLEQERPWFDRRPPLPAGAPVSPKA